MHRSASGWVTALILLGQAAAGQSAPARVARPAAVAVPARLAPTVDGRLDEAAWQEAPAIGEFVQHEPHEGAPPSEPTVVRILYDREALYIGAWLYDRDPAGIVQGETRRDASLDDTDAVLILLDTFRDRQSAFVFGTNPAGIEYDGQVTGEGAGNFAAGARQQVGAGGGFNLNWDGSWTVATSRDGAGWYAEFRIPFATLRYPAGGPQTWGLNLARHIRRRNEQVFWAPIGRQYDLYRVSGAGVLELEAPARRVMTVTPYVLGSVRRDFQAGTAADGSAEAGGDAKVGLTSSLALDLTVNTDFAQVEVDERQVNLTRFNLFFPEKRPFFLENAGTFAVGTPQSVELFFSRRIGLDSSGAPVPITAGGRLTGKIGGFTVGLLDLRTESVTGVLPATNYAAARVLRDLPNRSRLGVLAVSRAAVGGGPGDHNRTYAVDGRLGIGDAVLIDAYAAATETPGLAGREHAASLSAAYTTRQWRVEAAYREVGEAFNPEVGFLERAGYRYVSAFAMRYLRPQGLGWLRELRPHVSYRGFFDFSGFNETRNIHFDTHFEFPDGAFFSPAFNLTREGLRDTFDIAPGVRVPPGTYDNVEAAWRFNTDESAPLALEGELNVGGFLSGTRRGGVLALTGRRGATIAASLRLRYDDVELAEGEFTTTLVSLRTAYSFTPRIYLQALVQYSNRDRNWSGNLRFGWLNTAGTGLFLVYNETQGTGSRSGPLDRAFILKFTRQFALAG
ncbi:MAG TPA: DUF5916 domain-containing protein [Gemmatimonadales bacterium]|nr:DUF5916 domain-containing protein [Gemmatimonadales bacterium]